MIVEIVWRPDAPKASGAPEQRFSITAPGSFVIGRGEDADIVLPDTTVSRRHAVVTVAHDSVRIRDEESANGTRIGDRALTDAMWAPGDLVHIGEYVLELVPAPQTEFKRASGDTGRDFPPKFFDEPVVSTADLKRSGKVAAEVDYLAAGAGLGSFIWIDYLRIFGVPAKSIRAIGVDPVPYAKYKRLCAFSQIPDHERLRSNSVSTPDNIWGVPGYAAREAWSALKAGDVGAALQPVWMVFGEPALGPSYTPRAGDVFDSIDRETARIGWDEMWLPGRILGIRKTDDGRYVVAYRIPADRGGGGDRNQFVIGRFLHLATGYPASRYLPDLQTFKRANPQSRRVVNAYDQHDDVYGALEKHGGTIVVRGRGIVASRILQRLSEARQKNNAIRVLHVMRSPIKKGKTYDLSRRYAANDIELQPFNWPKACWGGTLRKRLEDTKPEDRHALMNQWAGTTTADRPDWDDLIHDGKREGWYKAFFGNVTAMSLEDEKVVTELESTLQFKEKTRLEADYVIDCTGLIADLESNPLLRDLIETYKLPRNAASGPGPEQALAGIYVSNSFEIESLRNGDGRAFAAGVLTLNGPYAAVDSFLGLQYSALRSVDLLAASGAPNIRRMGPFQSFAEWRKWCRGDAP